MEKVYQEFHCHRCPGKGTYILVRLNLALNHTVAVVCPRCGAEHERGVVGGVLTDRGKSGAYKETIHPPRSACSDTPRSEAMKKAQTRGGAVVQSDEQLVRDALLRERWVELYGGNL